MNLEAILNEAAQQRNRARALTTHGHLERARGVLGVLIDGLRDALARVEHLPHKPPPDTAQPDLSDVPIRSQLARALADAYGMLGGVEWRDNNLVRAADAYRQGRDIEQGDEYGVSDSYNLTNYLVVLILCSPGELSAMRAELEAAVDTVRAQVEGERRDQWWAWADYGLLSLLLGRSESALRAYERFELCGPPASDRLSCVRVIASLRSAGVVDGEALPDGEDWQLR
ncbi:hypothetical protein [Verrucosispora sp. NA02020]|uniref:hypothetical protein n=1 Tax=Verrucosispora sp. NA02020 TaxID=2742132 RepID=UPI0015920B3F|nr:hypothetical protein [Verrucosispora sp. NA02020]QKW11826.1 hypothetical protein HUT12_02845 [Verrucosispora sp. NA02020]